MIELKNVTRVFGRLSLSLLILIIKVIMHSNTTLNYCLVVTEKCLKLDDVINFDL